MELAPIIEQYLSAFRSRYASRLLPGHLNAIGAMLRCRTVDAGEILLTCNDCNVHLQQPHSCGHRSCPKCQNHEASQWLDRQQAKLLPATWIPMLVSNGRCLTARPW